jgi:hypothetical protein
MALVCIMTKYHGPGNVLGSRISACTGDNNPGTGKPDRLTIGYPHELSGVEVHAKAAKALAEKHGWNGVYVAGDIGSGYAFIRLVMNEAGTLPALLPHQIAFVVEPS